MAKLTKNTVERTPIRKKAFFLFDDSLPGFCVRIAPNGKLRERNEALDCRVYARAAASALGIDRFNEGIWEKLERNLGQNRTQQAVQTETTKQPPSSPIRKTIKSTYL